MSVRHHYQQNVQTQEASMSRHCGSITVTLYRQTRPIVLYNFDYIVSNMITDHVYAIIHNVYSTHREDTHTHASLENIMIIGL